jgi:peptidoglycan endopeptidase LytE
LIFRRKEVTTRMRKTLIASVVAFFISVIFVIPASAQHYVESGDTLYKIADAYSMDLKDLISLNPHIENPNVIHVGDYIVVRTGVETPKDLVDYARSLQESTKYVYGGQDFSPPMNTDCSGFVQAVFKKFGVNLPRTSAQQAVVAFGTPVKFPDLQIGDLMFFSTRADKKITHVGIYMGTETQTWISNLNEKKDVQILSSWGKWTQDYFMWGQRVKL